MRRTLVAALFLTAASTALNAQPPVGPPPADRARLEQQFRERVAQVVQRRLQLNDQQMQQLQQANRKFDRDRVQLVAQERQVRMAIRDQIVKGDKASQDQLSSLLDSAIVLQRRRVDLLASEQKELAGFMTPLQRAQYFGLQTQIRERMDRLRMQSRAGRRPEPPRD